MKAPVFYVLGALAVLSVVAASAQATTLTCYGRTTANAPVPTDYGSDVSADTLEFVTTDGVGPTPNIALAWPAWEGSGSVFEFHAGAGFAAANEEPIIQLQMEGRAAEAAIMFTPDPGYAVKIISFDMGSANNSGPTTPYTWTVTVAAASNPTVPLLTKVTEPHGRTALTVETVGLNFVGAPSTAYIMKLYDGGIESYNGCIDNIKFGQIPEPSVVALLLAGLLGVLGVRGRR